MRRSAAKLLTRERAADRGEDREAPSVHPAKTSSLQTTRRFQPPLSVEQYNDACFIVRDVNGTWGVR